MANFSIKHSSTEICSQTVNGVVSSCPAICLSGYMYPFETIELTCSGVPEVLYDDYYPGDYLLVLLNGGLSYEFSSTVGTDNITIATNGPSPVGLKADMGSIEFTPPSTGEYRIYIHSDPYCGIDFSARDIIAQCLMTCAMPTITHEIILDCLEGEFLVEFDVTSLGSASSLLLSDGTEDLTIPSIGTYIMGPYTPATIQNFTVVNDDDPICTTLINNVTSECPITNDHAAQAIAITLGNDCAGGYHSNTGATSDDEPVSPINSVVGNGVWFKFVAPASGAVRITTDGFSGSLLDTRITLFSATDSSEYSTFVPISADEDNGVSSSYGGIGLGYLSTIYTTALTPSVTYYVKVEGYSMSDNGTFCLRVDELDNSMLSTISDCDEYLQSLWGDIVYAGEMSFVDNYGKLVAILRNPAGTYIYDYIGQSYFYVGTPREDIQGNKYINRNATFISSDENVEVQLFFLDTELAATGITLSEMNITEVDLDACTETVDGTEDRILITPSSYGSAGGVSWIKFTTPSFSTFFMGATASPLSIRLGDIKATNKGTINVIEWNTLSADGTDTMTLERSADAQTFYPIHTVQSSNQPASYTYDDVQPISGVNFYRLAMKDANGDLTYSTVVNATMQATQANIQIFPNPTDKSIQVKLLNSNSHATITIVDMTGKVVKLIENIVDASIEIDVQDLPQGHYMLKYNDGRTQEIFKVTKL